MPNTFQHFSEGDTVADGYQIVGVAGSGGMGVVYRARDLRLERTVALKFLPADLADHPREKERFLREARTASALDHPNVGVIYGIEETPDQQTFIVMAFYEGASLAEKMRQGSLPATQAVEIALQIASGLAEAHARGVVHRDIKPSNVMMTIAGIAKVVDFGLAYIVTAETASRTGTTGTVAYMSPEQAMGKVVDARCDIWALGVVLAEMLTGANPFQRETLAGILFAILNDAPANLDGIEPELRTILFRMLSKNVAGRYASCRELIADLNAVLATMPGEEQKAAPRGGRDSAQLRRVREQASLSTLGEVKASPDRRLAWGIAAGVLVVVVAAAAVFAPAWRDRVAAAFQGRPKQKHIAVLPFESEGGSQQSAALSDGLMDSLTDRLANLDAGDASLWVVPAREVRRRNIYDAAQAFKALGTNLVVEGSVKHENSGTQLRVELIDAAKMRELGSATFEDAGGDLATLENEAVDRLATMMDITGERPAAKAAGGAGSPVAYEGYLTALGYLQRYDKAGNLDRAIDALQSAVKTDPRFALGYAELGEAYRLQYQTDKNPACLEEAESNCRRALELDKSLPAVYVTLGKIHQTTGKHDLALDEFQQALNLNPRDSSALSGLARTYESAGRIADAEATYRKAADIQPDNWDGFNNLGMFLDRQGKYAEAIEAYQRALALTPDNADVLLNMGGAYIDSGDTKQLPLAENALKHSLAIHPSYAAYVNLGVAYSEESRFQDSVEVTQKALAMNSHDYMVWVNLLSDYESLGEQKEAAAARTHVASLLEQEIKMRPQDVTAHALLADTYAGEQKRAQAMAQIDTALALDPKGAPTLASIADAYANLNERQTSIRYIGLALKNGLPVEQLRSDPELRAEMQDPAVASMLRKK